jgi:LytS/YehU family sensor histidine kinase
MFQIPIHILVICLNLFVLVPRLLGKGKFIAYSALLLASMLVASATVVAGYYLPAFFSHRTIEQQYGPGRCAWYFFGNALSVLFAGVVITTGIALTVIRIRGQRRQQQLEKEQLEAELNFLKQQFNPHFLFNTINSIFFLIRKKPDTAAESLARFSDLLRYQLYECDDTRILLSKEVGYIKNSIELERLRQNDHLRVNCEIDTACADELYVAPFILMTFVENAFKHVSRETAGSNWITIRLALDGHELSLSISNSVSRGNQDNRHTGGIGLRNVRRRLDLLYPGKHRLEIQNDSLTFKVHLRLELLSVAAPASNIAYNV